MLSEKDFWIQEDGKKEILLENKAVTTVRVKEKNSPRGASALLPPTNPEAAKGPGAVIDRRVRPKDGRPRGGRNVNFSAPLAPTTPARLHATSRPLAGTFHYRCGRGRRQMDAADWWGRPSARARSEWGPRGGPPGLRVPAAPPAPSGIGAEGLPPPRASTRPAWAQRWGPGPRCGPRGRSRPRCRGRATRRGLRAGGRRFSFSIRVDPKDRWNGGGGSGPRGLEAQGAWDAAWKPAPRGARASLAQLFPGSALLLPWLRRPAGRGPDPLPSPPPALRRAPLSLHQLQAEFNPRRLLWAFVFAGGDVGAGGIALQLSFPEMFEGTSRVFIPPSGRAMGSGFRPCHSAVTKQTKLSEPWRRRATCYSWPLEQVIAHGKNR